MLIVRKEDQNSANEPLNSVIVHNAFASGHRFTHICGNHLVVAHRVGEVFFVGASMFQSHLELNV